MPRQKGKKVSSVPQTAITGEDQATIVSGDNNNVVGMQGVQIFGNVGGDIITGTVIKQYLRQKGQVIRWRVESEKTFLKRVVAEFVTSLPIAYAEGNETAKIKPGQPYANKIYVPLVLNRRMVDANGQSSVTAEWDTLAKFPCVGLLIGDNYDGKTLLMRKIAHDLAQQNENEPNPDKKPFPIYLPISRYPFSTANPEDILNLAAYACGQSPERLKSYWDEQKRAICLLVDGADDIPLSENQISERANFVEALRLLAQTRMGVHSLIIACKPNHHALALRTQVESVLLNDEDYVEWSLLPLSNDKISLFMRIFGIPKNLRLLIEKDIALEPADQTNGTSENLSQSATWAGSKYWRLVNKPGLIATLGSATRTNPASSSGNGMIARLPRSTVELCELFIRSLFDTSSQLPAVNQSMLDYDYEQVKKPALARIAYKMLLAGQNALYLDDDLCRELANEFEVLAKQFNRIRYYLPENWHVTEFLERLMSSPIANREAAQEGYFEFASTLYRDYFAAIYLQKIDDTQWQSSAEAIKKSGRERWEDAFIFLSDLDPSGRTTSADRLMDATFGGSDGAESAADLWLEKGNVLASRIPVGVTNEFFKRRQFIEEGLLSPSTTVRAVAKLGDHPDPRVAQQAVNILAKFGLSAVLPLIDLAHYPHPIVRVSALHTLLTMGMKMAHCAIESTDSLIELTDRGFSFHSNGTCNAILEPFVLVDVPRTCRAELNATFGEVDVDIFNQPCTFELWHEPVGWFAIDYFKQLNKVDWIGLAVACDTVKRCASLILQKALTRSQLLPFAEELERCILSYGRVGDRISNALKLNKDLPQMQMQTGNWLIADADNTYDELRLLFDRLNRAAVRTRAQLLGSLATPQRSMSTRSARLISQLDVETHAQDAIKTSVASLPSLHEIGFSDNMAGLAGSNYPGLEIGELLPSRYRTIETLSLNGELEIGMCSDSDIRCISIQKAHGWNGVRVQQNISINKLTQSHVSGIVIKTNTDMKSAY